MRKCHLLAFLALWPILSSAQGRISYTYDSAGNRVRREAGVTVQKAQAKQHDISLEGTLSDVPCDRLVKISPSPTEGVLRVSVPRRKASEKCTLWVYTSQGSEVLAGNITTDNTEIDIRQLPAGIYLLKVAINENSTTLKITKR